jgi:hypothetical protein
MVVVMIDDEPAFVFETSEHDIQRFHEIRIDPSFVHLTLRGFHGIYRRWQHTNHDGRAVRARELLVFHSVLPAHDTSHFERCRVGVVPTEQRQHGIRRDFEFLGFARVVINQITSQHLSQQP